jgi:hypothetical protein
VLTAAGIQLGHQTGGDFFAGFVGNERDLFFGFHAETDEYRVMCALRKFGIEGQSVNV